MCAHFYITHILHTNRSIRPILLCSNMGPRLIISTTFLMNELILLILLTNCDLLRENTAKVGNFTFALKNAYFKREKNKDFKHVSH